jgi:cellulose synthase/poly-beta-1,6-N-acetylglucosamine synthase-like glycosyltransferase
MINQLMMIITLVSIWLSLTMALIVLVSATHFWLKNSNTHASLKKLTRYPLITLVVPAHNEAVVIQQTAEAILNMNYPAEKVELLLFADNCEDETYKIMCNLASKLDYQQRKN